MASEPARSRHPLIQELIDEGRPGVCPLCDGPFPPRRGGRLRVHCGDVECKRTYMQLARRSRRPSKAWLDTVLQHLRACARWRRSQLAEVRRIVGRLEVLTGGAR